MSSTEVLLIFLHSPLNCVDEKTEFVCTKKSGE